MSSDYFFALKYVPNVPKGKCLGSAQALLGCAFNVGLFQDLFLYRGSELP